MISYNETGRVGAVKKLASTLLAQSNHKILRKHTAQLTRDLSELTASLPPGRAPTFSNQAVETKLLRHQRSGRIQGGVVLWTDRGWSGEELRERKQQLRKRPRRFVLVVT